MNTIPYFYFDITARIIPGGLLLALLKVMGMHASSPWPDLFAGQEAWKAATVPLVFLGAAYLLGIVLDGVFRFSTLAQRFARAQYKKVHKRAAEEGLPAMPAGASSENFQFELWKWLALVGGPQNAAAFSLAHRFQAESRLLILSSIPAACLAGLSLWQRLTIPYALAVAVAAGLCVLGIFIWAAFNSERNRWTWALGAARLLGMAAEHNQASNRPSATKQAGAS